MPGSKFVVIGQLNPCQPTRAISSHETDPAQGKVCDACAIFSFKDPKHAYLHIAIDNHSRIAFSAILPDQTHQSAIRFFLMARVHYARFGISIRRILTDNGPCYRHWLFGKTMRDQHVKQRFTRIYTPRTNGKAERFIQTALREWAYARSYQNSAQRTEQLDP